MTSDSEEIKVLLLLSWQLNYHISETSGPSLLPLVISMPDWTQYNLNTFDLPPAQICAHGIIPHISTGADLRPHAHATTMPQLFWPRSGFPRFPGLVLVSTDSEWAGLPSWKVAWSYVLNFSSYSRSKLINFSVDSSGIFQRSSHLNTYRNEAFKDIFSCSSHSLWIWVIWRLKSSASSI